MPANSLEEILSDPGYQGLQPGEQMSIRRDFYRTKVAADPGYRSLPPEEKQSIAKKIFFPEGETTQPTGARPSLSIRGEFLGGLKDIAGAGDIAPDEPRPETGPGAALQYGQNALMRTGAGALRSALAPITAPITNLATYAGEKIQGAMKGTPLEKSISGTGVAPSDIAAGITTGSVETLAPMAALAIGGKLAQGARALNEMRPAVKARAAAEQVRAGSIAAEQQSLEKAALEAQGQTAQAARTLTDLQPKAQTEAATQNAFLENQRGQAQLDLAKQVQAQRATEKALEQARQVKPANEAAVGRVADSLISQPVGKEEAGLFFQKRFKEVRKLAAEEGGKLYDQAAEIAGDTAHARPNLMAAIDDLSAESGTLKTALSSRPQRIAGELGEGALPYREGTVAPTFRAIGKTEQQAAGGKSVLALDEEFFNKYKSYFSPAKPGESQTMPVEVWRDLTSGKLSQPRATISDMIVDRQKIRAAARAAESSGRYNEARQLGMLEDGITADISASSPEVSKAMNAADTFWREEYIPRFGYKAIPNKATRRAPEDAVNFFFRKESSPGAIQAAESLQSTLKNPADVARMGRAWLDGIVKRSVVKKTGEFSPDGFVNEYMSYSERVREIAAGGPTARRQLDQIVAQIQKANRTKAVAGELEQAAAEGERAVSQGARKVSQLAKERQPSVIENQAAQAESDLTAAAKGVQRTGKAQEQFRDKQAGILAKENEPSETLQYMGRRAPVWGAMRIVYGATTGNARAVSQGVMLMTAGEFSQLLASPSGRRTLSGLIATPPGTRQAVLWAARANSLLRDSANRQQQQRSQE